MSYPSCKHGHSHEMIPCHQCDYEKQIAELDSAIIANHAEISDLKKDLATELQRNTSLRKEIEAEAQKTADAYSAQMQLERDLAAAREEAKEDKEHGEALAKEVCQLQDALGCPCEMFHAQEKAMERIRDLIAAEGELGDCREQIDALAARADAAERDLVRVTESCTASEEAAFQYKSERDSFERQLEIATKDAMRMDDAERRATTVWSGGRYSVYFVLNFDSWPKEKPTLRAAIDAARERIGG